LIYRHVKTYIEAEGSYFNIYSKLSNQNLNVSAGSLVCFLVTEEFKLSGKLY